MNAKDSLDAAMRVYVNTALERGVALPTEMMMGLAMCEAIDAIVIHRADGDFVSMNEAIDWAVAQRAALKMALFRELDEGGNLDDIREHLERRDRHAAAEAEHLREPIKLVGGAFSEEELTAIMAEKDLIEGPPNKLWVQGGNGLQQERLKLGMSVEEAAGKLHVTTELYERWEGGVEAPPHGWVAAAISLSEVEIGSTDG